jgi:hypothetical protein
MGTELGHAHGISPLSAYVMTFSLGLKSFLKRYVKVPSWSSLLYPLLDHWTLGASWQ